MNDFKAVYRENFLNLLVMKSIILSYDALFDIFIETDIEKKSLIINGALHSEIVLNDFSTVFIECYGYKFEIPIPNDYDSLNKSINLFETILKTIKDYSQVY